MKAMLSAWRRWFMGRTPRERLMLTVLAAACGLFVGWLGARAVWDWRGDAAERRVEAVRALSEVNRAVQTSRSGGGAPAGLQVEATAVREASAAGFEPVFEATGEGLAFAAEEATTAALFGWLARLSAEGVQVRTLTVTENADATLSVQGVLASAA